MEQKEIKKKKVISCVAIVVSYIAMYGILLCTHHAVNNSFPASWMKLGAALAGTILIAALIYFFIPYETFAFMGETNKVTPYVTYMVALFFCVSGFGIFEDVLRGDYYVFFLTALCIFLLPITFKLIKSTVILFLLDTTMIVINAWGTLYITKAFSEALIIAVGLSIAWLVFCFLFDCKLKFEMLLISLCTNGAVLFLASVLTGHDVQFYRYGMLLNDRPLAAMVSYFWGWLFALFCLAIVLMGVVVIYSRKLLSKVRYGVLLAIYIQGVVLFVYTLLSDLAFVPKSSAPLMNPCIHILYIGVMLRLFKSKKVNEDIVNFFMKVEYAEEDDLDNKSVAELELMIQDIDIMLDIENIKFQLCNYLSVQEQKIKILEEKIKEISGEEIKYDTEDFHMMENFPRTVDQLMQVLRNKEEEMKDGKEHE